jgi:hypothetical protein
VKTRALQSGSAANVCASRRALSRSLARQSAGSVRLNVSRYADNGNVRTKQELSRYFAEYRKRAPLEHLYHTIEQTSVNLFRGYISKDSRIYDLSKRIYWQMKKFG